MRAIQIVSKILLLGSALALAACTSSNDDGDGGGGTPDATTKLVQFIAGVADDAGDPLPVNDGAFPFNDTSDRTRPLRINSGS